MKIEISPANIRTLPVKIYKNGKYMQARIAFPPDWVRDKNIKHLDKVVIAFICKADEDLKKLENNNSS